MNSIEYNNDFYNTQMTTKELAAKYHISQNDIMKNVEPKYATKMGRSKMFFNEELQTWEPKANFIDRIVAMSRTMSATQISKELNLPYHWVYSTLKSFGISIVNPVTSAADKVEEDIYTMWKKTTKTTAQIAKETKQSEKRVITILHMHGVKFSKDTKLDKKYIRNN